MKDYTPKSGKIEWHITYRCDLKCIACSRESQFPPHTEDMTLDDARECIRQADEIGWLRMPGPGNGAEPPRVIIIGGEPTMHQDFIEFIKLAHVWTRTYVEVYSNQYSEHARQMCELALRYGASINGDTVKRGSRTGREKDGQRWNLGTNVSPMDVGLGQMDICYNHSSVLCGIGVDHEGYSLCPIGNSVAALLNIPVRTKNLADLFDIERAHEMSMAMCAHCGFEIRGRAGRTEEEYAKFDEYVAKAPKIRGTPVSPTWQKAIEELRKKGT